MSTNQFLSMPITRPLFDLDFSLIFKGQNYQISKCLFGLYSKKFRSSREFLECETHLEIQCNISQESFEAFLKGAQGHFYNLTPENAFEIYYICNEWEVESISAAATEFINTLSDIEQLLSQYRYMLSINTVSAPIENSLAMKINSALMSPSLHRLPIDAISKLLLLSKQEDIDQHLLLHFMIEEVKLNKPKATTLLQFLDPSELTQEEIESLTACEQINREMLRIPISKAISNLLEQLTKQNDTIDKLEAEVSSNNDKDGKSSGLQSKLHRLQKKVKSQAKQIQKQQLELITEIETKSHDIIEQITKTNWQNNQNKAAFSALEQKIDELKASNTNVFDELAKLQKAHQMGLAAANQPKKARKRFTSILRKKDDAPAKEELPAKLPKRRALTINTPDSNKKLIPPVPPPHLPRSRDRSACPLVSYPDRLTSMSPAPPLSSEEDIRVITKPYVKDFDGICAALNQICGGNAAKEGLLSITASSTFGKCKPYVVLDYSKEIWYWVSDDKSGQWIMFDFGRRQIYIEHYTLKTFSTLPGTRHIKSWVLQGSNDKDDWVALDEQINNSDLNGVNKCKTFACKSVQNPQRYIRLLNLGPNHSGTNELYIQNIEFYGQLE